MVVSVDCTIYYSLLFWSYKVVKTFVAKYESTRVQNDLYEDSASFAIASDSCPMQSGAPFFVCHIYLGIQDQ